MIEFGRVDLREASLNRVENSDGDMVWFIGGGWIDKKYARFHLIFSEVSGMLCEGVPVEEMISEGVYGTLFGVCFCHDAVEVVLEWHFTGPARSKTKVYNFKCSDIRVEFISWREEE